jgi:hypothetical protein
MDIDQLAARRARQQFELDRAQANPRYVMTTTKTIGPLRNRVTLHFAWQGGAYIDVSVQGNTAHPQEVINVWNYAEGKASIPFTKEALREKVTDWVLEYGELALHHDVTQNWGH